MIPLGILASSVRIVSDVLLAPTNLVATLVEPTPTLPTMNVKLTWTDRNTNETGHRVYRSSSPMDTAALPPPVAELGPNVTEWEDTSTPVDQETYYIVSAVRGAEEAFSDEVMIDLRETTYEVFISSGNFLVPDGVTEVDVLIVAGGGGGGSRQGGGGGAGGLRVVRAQVVPGETVPVIVGSGGLGGTNGGRGENGQDSSFGSLSAIGGGGGGGRTSGNRGADGGSGGGGAKTFAAGAGAGTAGQGSSGGRATTSNPDSNVAGGGGGASKQGGDGVGGEASGVGGDGGDGYLFLDLAVRGLGDAGWFSGGGGGGVWQTAAIPGQGGLGGGGSGVGNGISAPAPGFPGKPNTGGGGGGSNAISTAGGAGGSGIVVVCFPVGGLNPTLPESAISALRALTVTI